MTSLKLMGAAAALLLVAAPAAAAVKAPTMKPVFAKGAATAVAWKLPSVKGDDMKARPRAKPRPRAVSATDIAVDTSVRVVDGDQKLIHRVITNGPVPDTPRNRAMYGGPMSRGGEMTAPVGN
jgi:hypothetical protein